MEVGGSRKCRLFTMQYNQCPLPWPFCNCYGLLLEVASLYCGEGRCSFEGLSSPVLQHGSMLPPCVHCTAGAGRLHVEPFP